MISEVERPYEEYNYEHFMGYDRFKFVGDLIEDYMKKHPKERYKLLDIGCAKGEFIYYLNHRFDNIDCSGLEYLQGFVDIAKKEKKLQDVKFYCGDAQDFSLGEKFDIITAQGLVSVFEECEPTLENIYNHLSKGGVSLIFGNFNDNDIDMITKFRLNEGDSGEWHGGYNIFSLKRFERFFVSKGIESINFHKFTMSTDIKPSETNPLAGYTLNTQELGKIVVNGLYLIKNQYVVETIK